MENGSGCKEIEEEEGPPMRRVCYLAIFDKSANRIVGLKLGDSTFELPSVEIPEDLNEEGDEEAEESIEGLLGVSVYFSYLMCSEFNSVHGWPVKDCLRGLVYVDTCGEVRDIEEPLGWVNREEACKGKWVMKKWIEEGDAVRKEIERMFGELRNVGRTDDDRAWKTAGWCGRVTAWARAVLHERHLTMTGKLRWHAQSNKSSTKECTISRADDGQFQRMKSELVKGDDKRRKLNDEEDGLDDIREKSDLLFVKGYEREMREGERTAAVGRVVGKIMPEVLGVNEREGAMLQRDAGSLTDESFDEDALMETIFTMQTLSLDRVKELERSGILVADSGWVGANVEKILGHELLDDWSEVSLKNGNKDAKKKLERLRSYAPRFEEICREISGYKLPNVIVHGDLSLHNVGSRWKGEGGLYQIFDWEDCFIGNPLHDFANLLVPVRYLEMPGYVMNHPADRKKVCKMWLPSMSEAELKKLFEMIEWIEDLINIYRLSQQYSTYDSSMIEARKLVINKADVFLDCNRVMNARL